MRNIVITGAGGNLGQAVINEFAPKDYYLHLATITEGQGNAKQAIYTPDLTDPLAVQELADQVSRASKEIDAVIHLVGAYMPGDLLHTGLDDFEKMIQVNFYTAFNLVKAFLPIFTKSGKGKFIFIGAFAAMNPESASFNVAYALSKQMLPQLAYLVNQSDKAHTISAHVLLPKTLDTELNRKAMPDADHTKWTSMAKIATTMYHIIEGDTKDVLINF